MRKKSKYKNNLVYIFLFMTTFSCSFTTYLLAEEHTPFKVYWKGTLMNLMRENDLTSKISLKELESIPNLYVVGQYENLAGEIQIFDGKPYNSYAKGKNVLIDSTFNKNATLLAWASVPKWKSIELKINTAATDEIEDYIETEAGKNGVNIFEPFPFMLEGTVNTLDWHVINWNTNESVHSYDKHKQSGPSGSLNNSDVIMFGIFSSEHQGIISHHSSRMHLHFKTKDGKLAGFVDKFDLNEKLILKIPDVK